MAIKAFWYYFYYALKNGKIFCGARRTILNIFILAKNLFGQDSKDLHVNLAYFVHFYYLAIMGLKISGWRIFTKLLQIFSPSLHFERLWNSFLCFVTNLLLCEKPKNSEVSRSDRKTNGQHKLGISLLVGPPPPAKNLLIPFNQEKYL